MCLGIPGQIIQVADSALQLAVVDVCGVKREVNISLICQDDPKPLGSRTCGFRHDDY